MQYEAERLLAVCDHLESRAHAELTYNYTARVDGWSVRIFSTPHPKSVVAMAESESESEPRQRIAFERCSWEPDWRPIYETNDAEDLALLLSLVETASRDGLLQPAR